MYYFFIILAVFGIVANFCFGKIYAFKVADTKKNILLKIILESVLTAFLFWGMGGFVLTVNRTMLLFSLLMALIGMVSTAVCFWAYGRGNLSLFTMFQMQGGMLLPYIYGIWYGNTVGIWRIIGMILMVGALFFTVQRSQGEKNVRLIPGFIGLCAGIFLINGGISILSYIYANSKAGMEQGGLYSFMLWKSLLSLAIALIPYATMNLIEDREVAVSKREKQPKTILVIVGVLIAGSVVNALSYWLQLVCGGHLPAVAMYPLVTGGCVIFTAIAGWLFFKEKVSLRMWIGIAMTFLATVLFVF